MKYLETIMGISHPERQRSASMMAACGDPAQEQRQSYVGANIKCHAIHIAIMVKVHRVVLSHDTYEALQAEAMVRQSSIQTVMDSIIMSNISQKAREILKTLDTLEHTELKTVGVIEHMDKSITKPKKL